MSFFPYSAKLGLSCQFRGCWLTCKFKKEKENPQKPEAQYLVAWFFEHHPAPRQGACKRKMGSHLAGGVALLSPGGAGSPLHELPGGVVASHRACDSAV